MFWTRMLPLTAVAIVMGALFAPLDALAQRRQSASFCLPITGAYQDVRSNTGAIGNAGTATMRLACPIIDDDNYLPKDTLATARVDVYDGTSAASLDARACVTYGYMQGGACGPAAASSASGTGMNALFPDVTVWYTYYWEYGYILVNLPPAQSGRASAVHGYFLTN
jgi:hypothetical protein